MSKYEKTDIGGGRWVITEAGHDYQRPSKACTFAIDTETQVYFKGRVVDQKTLYRLTRRLKMETKRKYVSTNTWAWQCYDECNGFFMTNDFEAWLTYQCLAGYKFGWCYNATFDFAQIDYELLGKGKPWKQHQYKKDSDADAYNKGQPYTYESLHSDMGARYSYKLWFPYRARDRHTYVHAVEFRDFMKLVSGGLAKLLEDLDVRDEAGEPIRKLKMDYQGVDPDNLDDAAIDYCRNDVKGLYYAIKKMDASISEITDGESRIFGSDTNVMTAGGLAKAELLRSLYPDDKTKGKRLKHFQKDHPLLPEQDRWLRSNHLYRGGICYVNPRYRGRLLTKEEVGRPMNRFDVNSEYPYSMASINDLVGAPSMLSMQKWLSMPKAEKDKYECIYLLKSVAGRVKPGMLGMWYDPFLREYVDVIDQDGLHLMFEREVLEMSRWYDDFEYDCDDVVIIRRGEKSFKPFVDKYYSLKRKAKREKNGTMQAVAKLLLNSSYGKLAERIVRAIGHYELSQDTNAVHFVRDGEEESSQSAMNVIIGALVASFARCYILSKIREVTKGKVAERFVYIDTDSIHCFADYDEADDYRLGALKLEAVCDAVKYIAPKTYFDIKKVGHRGIVSYRDIEVHTKGVSVKSFFEDLNKKQKGKINGQPTLELINRKFGYGVGFVCLVAMNVPGGKALLPTLKMLATLDQAPADNPLYYANTSGSTFLQEA